MAVSCWEATVANAVSAVAFFELLGFRKHHVALTDGGAPARYMGMHTMKAQHITLLLAGAEPLFEIQLLAFDPTPRHQPRGKIPLASGARSR